MAVVAADLEHSHYWSDDWDPGFYVALARAGFISTSTNHPEMGSLLIPELQVAYAVLDEGDLHISRNVAKLMSSGRLEAEQIELAVSDDCENVLAGLLAYHDSPTWLSEPYCQLVRGLSSERAAPPPSEFRLRGIELWSRSEDRLVAGELGYSIGRTYTSLSGFFVRHDTRWRDFGTLQLVLLARRLQSCGYAFWNLGQPHMPYKRALGAKVLPRAAFLERWHRAIVERPEREL